MSAASFGGDKADSRFKRIGVPGMGGCGMSISGVFKKPETVSKETENFINSRRCVEDGLADLSYANGLMTAVIAGPEPVSPSEWLPWIVDLSSDEQDKEEIQLATSLMMIQYNEIVDALASKDKIYEPFYWSDRGGRVITSDWAEGFMAGVHLRYDAWAPLLKGEDRSLVGILGILQQDEEMEARMTAAGFDPEKALVRARSEAPQVVSSLYERLAKRKSADAAPTRQAEKKAGRNDPCPCGSGKKYKKCCLN